MTTDYARGGSVGVAIVEVRGYDTPDSRLTLLERNSPVLGGQAPCESGAASAFVVHYDHGACSRRLSAPYKALAASLGRAAMHRMLRRRAGGPRAAACDSGGGQRRASPRRLRTLTRAGHLA